MKKLKKGEAKKSRRAAEVKARSATPKAPARRIAGSRAATETASASPTSRSTAASKTGSVTPPATLKTQRSVVPYYATQAGGVRIVLDLDDLARTLNSAFRDSEYPRESLRTVLTPVQSMLKPWGLPEAVLERFRRIAETGAP